MARNQKISEDDFFLFQLFLFQRKDSDRDTEI